MSSKDLPHTAQVADRLHSAAIHLLRSLRKQDEVSGLSAPRLSALSVLVFAGPRTIGQLAHAEQVSAPTMTRLVYGLEHDGLATRKSDQKDGRVIWVQPTAKGRRVLRQGRERRVAELGRRLHGLTPEDAKTLGRAAEIIETFLRKP